MRRLILGLAWIAPILSLLLWQHSHIGAIAVLMLSHALLLLPTLVPNLQWLGPVVTRFQTTSRHIWLTIDDGPTDDTMEILDLLDRYDARATFFVKGALARAFPERIRAIVARGHGIANHSEHHPAGSFWCLPPRAIAQEIAACNEAIEVAIGAAPFWFRAPVGMKNPFVHPELARRGMRLIGWSVRGFDTIGADHERVTRRLLRGTKPGAILVMHQGRIGISSRCIEHSLEALTAAGYRAILPTDADLREGSVSQQ